MVVIVVMIVMWTCHVDVGHTRILQAELEILKNIQNLSNNAILKKIDELRK